MARGPLVGRETIGSIHSSHIMKTFTGVTNDTNEGFVPFWSNKVRVLAASWVQSAAIEHVGSLETLCYTSGSQIEVLRSHFLGPITDLRSMEIISADPDIADHRSQRQIH